MALHAAVCATCLTEWPCAASQDIRRELDRIEARRQVSVNRRKSPRRVLRTVKGCQSRTRKSKT